MRQFSKDFKVFICNMVKQKIDAGEKISDVLKFVEDHYKVNKNLVYIWNKKLGFIFETNLIDDVERIYACHLVKILTIWDVPLDNALEVVAKAYGVSVLTLNKWNLYLKDRAFRPRRIYSVDERKSICNEVKSLIETHNLETVTSVKQVAEKYSISYRVIYDWNKIYQIFPVKTLNRRKCFTNEEIEKILCEIKDRDPVSLKQVAEKYGVSQSTINRWNREKKVFVSSRIMYPEELKKQSLESVKNATEKYAEIKKIAEENNIYFTTVFNWVKNRSI